MGESAMSTSRFSVDDHASLRASPATAAGNSQGTLSQPPSRAVGVETVRSLTLMLMAACLTTLVLLTQRLLQSWAGDDLFLGWTVLWCVMLAALLGLSRLSNDLVHRTLANLDDWALRLARHRALRRQRSHAG